MIVRLLLDAVVGVIRGVSRVLEFVLLETGRVFEFDTLRLTLRWKLIPNETGKGVVSIPRGYPSLEQMHHA